MPSSALLPRLLLLAALGAVPGCELARAALGEASPYTVRDLGEGVPFEINDTGAIVGSVQPQWDWQAFLLEGGKKRLLGALGGKESHGYGLNARGEAVGYATDAAGERHAFLWREGRMEKLDRVPGAYSGWANAISDRGVVVGGGVLAGEGVAWVWENGRMRRLEGLVPGGEARAEDVSDAGWVVGSARDAERNSHAVLWRDGRLVRLGSLGGRESFASAVNARGQVVGTARTPEGVQHAFLWEDGVMKDLTPPGAYGGASAINDRGQVVGWASTPGGRARAVLWEDGAMHYLDERIPSRSGWRRLSEAVDVNDRGEIIGKGYRGGKPGSFLLTPRR